MMMAGAPESPPHEASHTLTAFVGLGSSFSSRHYARVKSVSHSEPVRIPDHDQLDVTPRFLRDPASTVSNRKTSL